MTSNVSNPLLLPEIAQQVASLSENRERLGLAYTCRQLFSSATPFVWESLCGVQPIMKLIPGVKFVEELIFDEHGSVNKILTHIIIDQSALTEDWTRYWFYAPFVKHIAPFLSYKRSYGENLRVRGWRFLFMKLNGGTLLPNLRSVDAERQNLSSCFDQLAWFALLLSPSLQRWYLGSIQWDNRSHGLPIRPFDLLLGAISRYSSNDPSRTTPTRDEWYPSERALASICPSEYQEGLSWFASMPAPTNLRYLEIHLSPLTNILWDELYTLGCLPFLEALIIRFAYAKDEAEHNFRKEPLPSNMFPCLKKLDLIMIPHVSLFRWIWELKPLVSRLLSTHIGGWEIGFDCETFASIIVQLLHKNSPNLVEFGCGFMVESGAVGLLQAAYQLLSVMPIETLVLDGVDIGFFPPNYSENTFPHLRHLRLQAEYHFAGCNTFPKIAKVFPNLEYLYVNPLSSPYPCDPSDMNLEHTAFQPIEIYIPGISLSNPKLHENRRKFTR
ncbi:unnamed protein product [Rhizoctonia solani]|nr:unnamed protein product [Rhizoctonia solani]